MKYKRFILNCKINYNSVTFSCTFNHYSTSTQVTFYHDHDLGFEQIGQLQMLVVQAEVKEEGVEVLAAYMFRPLAVVEVVAEVQVVEVAEYLEGLCRMEGVADSAEVVEQPVIGPKVASMRPNFAPWVVQKQKLEGPSAVAVGLPIPSGLAE